jgi:hypothetical protein
LGDAVGSETDADGIKTVATTISLGTLRAMAEWSFGNLVKAVVDVARVVMVVNAEMHADEEALLLEGGSRQVDLWGINLYPDRFGTADFIEFDSMINVPPRQGNRSRSIEDPEARRAVIDVVARLIEP